MKNNLIWNLVKLILSELLTLWVNLWSVFFCLVLDKLIELWYRLYYGPNVKMCRTLLDVTKNSGPNAVACMAFSTSEATSADHIFPLDKENALLCDLLFSSWHLPPLWLECRETIQLSYKFTLFKEKKIIMA